MGTESRPRGSAGAARGPIARAPIGACTIIRIPVIPSAEFVGEAVVETIVAPAGTHTLHTGFATLPVDEGIRDLVEELARHHFALTPPLRAHGCACQVQPALCTRDANVGEPAFLGELIHVLHGARMWEGALLHAREEHNRVFQALGCMQCHQRHLAAVMALPRQLVRISDQRGGLKEACKGGIRRVLLELRGHRLQLGKVLHTRFILRILGFAQQLQHMRLLEHLRHNLAGLGVMLSGECPQRRHEFTEGAHRIRRTGTHALDVLKLLDRPPERLVVLVREQREL